MQLSSFRVGDWEEIKHWSEIRLALVDKKRILISGVITFFFKEPKGAVISRCLERERERKKKREWGGMGMVRTQQMVERMWRKGNTCALMMEM